MIDDPTLQQMFRAESDERLAKLDSGLLLLEQTPDDLKLIEELFREIHSLKGAARMLGLMPIETTAHGLESLLNPARNAESPLTPAAIESLNAGIIKLRSQIQEVLSQAAAPAAPPSPAMPPAQRKAAPAVPVAGEPFRIETVRVETGRLDELLTLSDELGVLQGRRQHVQAMMARLQDQWTQLEHKRRQSRSKVMDDADLASLGNLLQSVHDRMREDTARFDSTLDRLEEHVRDMRLLPLATVFNVFPRMVRDLGKELGKEVEFLIDGEDLTLDKHILEEIKDPLMHLLRNAIGHGIEPGEERLRLGKRQAGLIRLAASRGAGRVSITVEDDGRGLDLDAIRNTALRLGLANDEALAAMPAEQLQELVFTSGFSTLSYVTEMAGRGIGLDVVRAKVEALKGSIRIDSRQGRGTAFTLLLPLSISTLRMLLVTAAGRNFGLPIDSVQTLRRVPENACYVLEGRLAIDFDGQPLLAAKLADLLKLPDIAPADDAKTITCVILRVDHDRLALQVDDILAEEEVVPRPLGQPLRRVRNVAGLATLASGELCPVLNPADLLHPTAKLSTLPTKAAARRMAAGKRSILLVEDSALVRAMQKRIIEDSGYEVVTAVDGIDALDKLARRTFAGIVSDIQMPNLDGLALTARIRENARFRDLPVILVTTLSSDEDKRRGLEAGANAYIPKPSFDQVLLLETLKRLVGP